MFQSLKTTKLRIFVRENAISSNDSNEDIQELGKKGDITPQLRKAKWMRYEDWKGKEFLWMPEHVN